MSNYQSKYNGGVPTKPAQYLTDIMCEREAVKLGRSLFLKYWQDPFWKNKYAQHIIAVSGLLKIYSVQAIENALKRKDGKWILSFRVKQFTTMCLEEQSKLDKKTEIVNKGVEKELPVFDDEEKIISKPFGHKTGKNKLDE